MTQVTVIFEVNDREQFLYWLQFMTGSDFASGAVIPRGEPLGYRADDVVQRREALTKFVDRMELVLRQHDAKTTWRERPVEALVRLMKLELAEFDVAFDFFEVNEIRKELVDLANYAMIVDDRLSLLQQDRPIHEQVSGVASTSLLDGRPVMVITK